METNHIFLDYMGNLNKPYKSTKRSLLDKVIDHWLVRFAGIAFLFLLARIAADSLAIYAVQHDLINKLHDAITHQF